MDFELVKTIFYLLTGGFLIFLAITVTRDNFVNRLNRLSGAMLFCAGLGPVFMAMGLLMAQSTSGDTPFNETATYQLHHLWEFFFPILLAFAWRFPYDRLREFRHPWLRYLIFLPQIMHLLIMLFFDDISGVLSDLEAGTAREGFFSFVLKPFSYLVSVIVLFLGFIRSYEGIIFAGINVFYTFLAAYFLETGHRYLTNPRLLNQTRIVLWAMRVGLGLYVIAVLGLVLFPSSFPEGLYTFLLILAALGGAVIIAFAIIRYQFLDVRLVFRQSLIYTFTSAILVGLYILIVMQCRRFLTPMFGERAEMVSYLFIVFVLLTFQPISNWIDNVIRSMFLHTRTDHRATIQRFSRQIISQFDTRRLVRTIEETMKTALLVERVSFVLYDDAIKDYAIIPSNDYPEHTVIARDDLMLRGINLLDSPTLFDSLEDYEEGSTLAATLKEQRAKLILPMKDAEHLLGFVALSSKVAGYRYTTDDYNLLGVLSNQMVSALTNARLYVESLERLRLQEEVNMARQIQVDLLPSEPPRLEKYAICAQSTPSRTVGGDFYDFIQIDGRKKIGIVIADASGKGMPAALMIAQIQAIIRSEVHNGNAIATMLKNMNQQVVESSSPETYVTLFYGELDTVNGTFCYANAGHNYPIIIRSDGSNELLDVGGPIIGALPFVEYESSVVQLKPEDVLFFFTDGLSEAMDDNEIEYGEPRILDFVTACRTRRPDEIMRGILEDVHNHDASEPPRDDTTIVTVKVLANGARPDDYQT